MINRLLPRLALIVGFAVQTNCVARQSSLAAGGPFLEKPYTQLGTGVATKADHLSVLWHAPDRDQEWKLEFRKAGSTSSWQAAKLSFHAVHVPTVEKHRVYEALLSGLEAGEEIDYRVALEGKSVFQAKTHAMPRPNQEYRFVVFGDSGDNSPAQRAIANQVYHDQPSMVFITGDIVYSRGRISEYRNNYFPIYNADWASPELGAPLLRSILFVAAPGNHDILRADFGKYPDTLAYFFYWSQPLNGPLDKAQTNIPVLAGSSSVRSAFLASAQDRYPRLANFSFNFGNAHWTVLDANPYADWRDPKLQNWLTHDLETAKDSTWRFVAFHQPPFSSSRAHFGENQMRNICELLELEHVDVVFAGHVHNCQRTYPLHFKVSPPGAPQHVNGEWKLDRRFDGKTQTKPDGIIYLVTGAGGAGLNNPDQQDNRASWQEYTFKFIAKEHSYTRVDVSGRRLTVNQISDRGKALDTFVVAK